MKTFLHAFLLTATAFIATPSAHALDCGGFGGRFAPNPYHPPVQPEHCPSRFDAVHERMEFQRMELQRQAQLRRLHQESTQAQFRQPHSTAFQSPPNDSQIPTFSRPTQSSSQDFFGSPAVDNNAALQSRIPQPNTQQPAAPQQLAPQSRPTASFQNQPQLQPPTQPSNVPPNSGTEAPADSETLSALQMLASLQENSVSTSNPTAVPTQAQTPEFASASPDSVNPQSVDSPQVGSWVVNLPSNQSIVLNLNADNTFSWEATKGESSSSFKGDYRLQDSRLILVRAMDLQQMAGTWTATETGFAFKLDGATNSGLAFTRQ